MCSLSSNNNYSTQCASSNNENIKIIDKHIIEKGQNDIEITYPQFCGLSGEQETAINLLIKNNIYEIVKKNKEGLYDGYNLLLLLDYKITHLSDGFISICYSGYWSPLNSGRGYSDEIYTINIDTAEAKIVNKKDIFKDEDQIFKLLMQDKFDSITEKEGIRYLFSFLVNTFQSSDPKDGLDSPNLKYYIDGEKLIFAVSDISDVYEYSIEINKVKDFLYRDILKKIQMEELFGNVPDKQAYFEITPRIVDEEKQIYTYDYVIYNKDGYVIKKGTHYGKSPSITFIADNLLEIQESAGTGIYFCTYCDINDGRISKVYTSPLATGYGKIAYSKGVNDPYTLIVSDIFDEQKYYEEFKLNDIADVLSPFEEVRFTDKNTLLIKYKLSRDHGEKTVTLNLMSAN